MLTAAELLKTNGIKVELGLSTQSQVEITSGLKDGDVILIPIQNNTSATKKTTTTTTTNPGAGFGGGNMPAGGNMPSRD